MVDMAGGTKITPFTHVVGGIATYEKIRAYINKKVRHFEITVSLLLVYHNAANPERIWDQWLLAVCYIMPGVDTGRRG
jgi:hypothetical protein